MKPLDPATKVSCGAETNSKKTSSFGRISLVSARKKCGKVSGYALEHRYVHGLSICNLFHSCVS
jgi:hypothetical protein